MGFSSQVTKNDYNKSQIYNFIFSNLRVSVSPWLMPWTVFVFVLVINLVTVWRVGFDGLYGQDAYSYYAHAGELRFNLNLLHHWQWETAPRPLFWPIGYPALVALLFLFTGSSAGAAQLVSMLAWAGAAGLLTDLGRKLSGSFWGGLAAGGLLALSPLGRQLAVSVMSDAAAVFWLVLAAWLIIRARENVGGWWLILAEFALGLAVITRYASAAAIPLLVIGAIWPLPKQSRLGLKWLVLALIAFGSVYLPQFVINQLHPASFWTDSWLTDWSPLNAWQSQFNTRDGYEAYSMPPIVFYLGYALLNIHLLTPLALLLVGLGLLYLWQLKRQFELVWLVSWWLFGVALLSGIPYESERFTLTYLPPLVLLAGLGVVWLIKWAENKKFLGRRKTALITIFLAIGAIGLGVLSQHHVDGFMALKAADLGVVRQVEQKLPAESTLITFGLSLTFDHYTNLKIHDLSFENANSIATLANGPSVYLLADAQNMQQQWVGHPTGDAFQAALGRAEPVPLGQFGRYTLWKLHQ